MLKTDYTVLTELLAESPFAVISEVVDVISGGGTPLRTPVC